MATAQATVKPIDEKTFRESSSAAGVRRDAVRRPAEGELPGGARGDPTGEFFVAVDEQGSLGRTPGGGKVLRCVDKDGDGKVDEVTVFAKMDHPRGLIYHDGNASGSCTRRPQRLPRRAATASPTGRRCSSPA